MNLFEEEIIKLLSALKKHDVRFILVGGLAVNFYGYGRTTGDVDVWLDESKGNRKKLVSALNDLGVSGAEVFMDYPLVAGYAEVLLENGIYVDMMADMVYFKQKNFDECYMLSENFEITKDVPVKVIHINKLIEEKENGKRPKDKEDAEQLKKIINRR